MIRPSTFESSKPRHLCHTNRSRAGGRAIAFARGSGDILKTRTTSIHRRTIKGLIAGILAIGCLAPVRSASGETAIQYARDTSGGLKQALEDLTNEDNSERGKDYKKTKDQIEDQIKAGLQTVTKALGQLEPNNPTRTATPPSDPAPRSDGAKASARSAEPTNAPPSEVNNPPPDDSASVTFEDAPPETGRALPELVDLDDPAGGRTTSPGDGPAASPTKAPLNVNIPKGAEVLANVGTPKETREPTPLDNMERATVPRYETQLPDGTKARVETTGTTLSNGDRFDFHQSTVVQGSDGVYRPAKVASQKITEETSTLNGKVVGIRTVKDYDAAENPVGYTKTIYAQKVTNSNGTSEMAPIRNGEVVKGGSVWKEGNKIVMRDSEGNVANLEGQSWKDTPEKASSESPQSTNQSPSTRGEGRMILQVQPKPRPTFQINRPNRFLGLPKRSPN